MILELILEEEFLHLNNLLEKYSRKEVEKNEGNFISDLKKILSKKYPDENELLTMLFLKKTENLEVLKKVNSYLAKDTKELMEYFKNLKKFKTLDFSLCKTLFIWLISQKESRNYFFSKIENLLLLFLQNFLQNINEDEIFFQIISLMNFVSKYTIFYNDGQTNHFYLKSILLFYRSLEKSKKIENEKIIQLSKKLKIIILISIKNIIDIFGLKNFKYNFNTSFDSSNEKNLSEAFLNDILKKFSMEYKNIVNILYLKKSDFKTPINSSKNILGNFDLDNIDDFRFFPLIRFLTDLNLILKNENLTNFLIDSTKSELKVIFKNYNQKKNDCQKLLYKNILKYLIGLDLNSSYIKKNKKLDDDEKKKFISVFNKLFNNIQNLDQYLEDIEKTLSNLVKKIFLENPNFLIDYYSLIAKIMNSLDFEKIAHGSAILVFFSKLLIKSFDLISIDFDFSNKSDFFLSLSEIWFIFLHNFKSINSGERELVFKMAEKTPFLKTLELFYLNKLDLEIIINEEKNEDDVDELLQEFKNRNYPSVKKLKKNSSNLYIYLFYFLFIAKIKKLEKSEYHDQSLFLDNNIIENLFFYLRDNFQQNLDDNANKFFSSLYHVVEIIKNEYLKMLKDMANLNLQNKVIEKDFIILIQYINFENKKVSKISKQLVKEYIYSFPQLFYSIKIFLSYSEIIQKLHKNLNSKYSTISPKMLLNFHNQEIPISSDKKILIRKLKNMFFNYADLYYVSFIYDAELAFKCYSFFINAYDDNRNQETIAMRFFYVLKQFSNICETLVLQLKDEDPKEQSIRKIYDKLTKKKEFEIMNKNINNFIKNIKSYDFINFELERPNKFLEHNLLKNFNEKEEIKKMIKNCFNYQLLYIQKYENNFITKELIDQLKIYLNNNTIDLFYFSNKTEKNYNYLLKTERHLLKKKIAESMTIFFLKNEELSPRIEFVISDVIKIFSTFKFDFIYSELMSQITKMMLQSQLKNKKILIPLISFIIQELTQDKYEKSYIFNQAKKKSFIFFKKDKLDLANIISLKNKINFIKKNLQESSQYFFISKLINFRDYYMKVNCLQKILNFLKKYLKLILVNSCSFRDLEQLMINILDMDYDLVRHLPLNSFLTINKLFSRIIILTLNDEQKLKISNERLILHHIFFNLNYFSKKFHLTYKDHTDYSINDLNSHKKIIKNLLSYYNFIKNYFIKLKSIPEIMKIKDYNQKSFFNNKTFSSFKKNYFYPKNEKYLANHFLVENDSIGTSLIYKGILMFLKTKVNLLRSVLYKEFENKRIPIFFDHLLGSNELSSCFREIFKINPLTANHFINLEYDRGGFTNLVSISKCINNNIYYLTEHAEFLKIIFDDRIINDFNNNRFIYLVKMKEIYLVLYLLKENNSNKPIIKNFIFKKLMKMNTEQANFYLFDLFQMLKTKMASLIKIFLMEFAKKSPLFSHQLIWQCEVDENSKPEDDLKFEEHKDKRIEGIILRRKIENNFTSEELQTFLEINQFLVSLTEISSKMDPKMPKSKKKEIIKQCLDEINIPKFAYLPTNPNMRVVEILKDTGRPMQSAAKCPFMLTFKCEKINNLELFLPHKNISKNKKNSLKKNISEEFENIRQIDIRKSMQIVSVNKKEETVYLNHNTNKIKQINDMSGLKCIKKLVSELDESHKKKNETNLKRKLTNYKQFEKESTYEEFTKKNNESNDDNPEKFYKISCIFKTKDDIRHDTLTLKFITLLKEIFKREKVNLYLMPYRTFSNRTGPEKFLGGIIEVVPNSISRDEIGKTFDCNLLQYFENKYNSQNSKLFKIAQENFIQSLAAYSIVSYLIQIKDRHNGNILIDKFGHIIHIDFGFIFDISPGGNIGFENAAFKLVKDMVNIMGGNIDSDAFNFYREQTIKAGLLARQYSENLFDIVRISELSGLKCFRKNSVEKFRKRFLNKKHEFLTAIKIDQMINFANDNLRTRIYDVIQYLQQKILH